MFAEPLFDINYMEKEMNAVNSEHEKNLNTDAWRLNRLLESLSNEDNPFNHFSTGSLQIFNQIRLFYNKYYRSNNMKLAVSSTLPHDDLQSLVKARITEIRLDTYNSDKATTNATQLYGNLFPVDRPFDNINKILWYMKLSEGKLLDILFPLDPIQKHYKTKPYDYLEYLLKYTGDKSLNAILREKGLAYKVDAKMSESVTNFAMTNERTSHQPLATPPC
jgi:insulysin